MKTITLKAHETLTLDRPLNAHLCGALEKDKYFGDGEHCKIYFQKEITVTVEEGDTGDTIETKLRESFSKGIIKIILENGNDFHDSDGINITNLSGDYVDLDDLDDYLDNAVNTLTKG